MRCQMMWAAAHSSVLPVSQAASMAACTGAATSMLNLNPCTAAISVSVMNCKKRTPWLG